MRLTPWRAALVATVALIVGSAAAWVAYGPGRLATSMPHLVAGWSMVGFGLIAWRRASWSRCGLFLVAAGFCWFAPDLSGCLNVEPVSHLCARIEPLDRVAGQLSWIWLAILNHALVTFPSGRADGPWQRVAIACGYLLALAIPTVPTYPTPLIGVLVVAGPTIRYLRTSGDDRADLVAAVLIGAGLALGIAVMNSVSAFVIELAITVMVGGLLAALLSVDARRAPLTADEAVGLGGALAAALRDPRLAVAFASSGPVGWVDGSGRAAAPVDPPADLETTIVERDGQPLARIRHGPQTLVDPRIRSAVTLAVELEAHHARLLRELDDQAAQLDASRRRLLDAAVRERQELASRVEVEVERPLERLTADLREVQTGAGRSVDAHVFRASEQLAIAQTEIRDLATGLYPSLLARRGLRAALEDLGSRAPIRVVVDAPDGITAGPDIDATIWFLCAEALANVGRHASAGHASVTVRGNETAIQVVVADDGAGGADPGRGTGLRALVDRVEAMGGTFSVDSRPGIGTRLEATFPVTPEARESH